MQFVQSEGTAARRRFPIYLVDATDGITPETGEAGGQPQISKNGGAWGNTTNTLTAVGNGKYYVELTAAELSDLGHISVRFKSANTAEFSLDASVVAISIHTANPPVNVAQWNGSAVATPSVAGVPEVDVTHWLGTATSLTDTLPNVQVASFAKMPGGHADVKAGPLIFKQSEGTAARRRVYFIARARDTAGTLMIRAGDPINSWTSATMSGRVSKNGAAGAAHGGTFTKVDSTSSPGLWYYEFTAAELDTLGTVTLYVSDSGILTGDESRMVPMTVEVHVVAADLFDAVRLGLTALPNANAEAAGGLITRGFGAGQLAVAAGIADANVRQWQGAAAAAASGTGCAPVSVKEWGAADGTVNALQSGRVDSHTGAMANNVITAAAINAAAITSAKFAASAIDSVAIATDAITATKIQAAAITSAKFAAGAINAAAIATDAIGASQLASGAADKIVAALMAFSHDTGVTVKGLFRRLDAVIGGKASGLKGATVRFFRRDNTTIALEVSQNIGAGSRATAATVTGSES